MSTARRYHTQQIHYLRKDIAYTDNGSTLVVGTIPAGSLVIKPISGVNVSTAFDGDTTNTLDLGPSTNTDLWATDLALGTAAYVPLDESVSTYVAAETEVQAVVVSTASATEGSGQIVIAYIPADDG